MAAAALTRSLTRYMLAALLLLSLLVALHLISGAVQNSQKLAGVFVPLLVFSLLGLTLLLVLVMFNLWRLVGAYWRGEPGTRLTARMVVLFVVLSLVPVVVVYSYSMQFLMRGIDSWFDVDIEGAMQESLGLGQASLDLHKRTLQRTTERILSELQGAPPESLTFELGVLRRSSGATELAIMDPTGRTMASNNESPGVLVAYPPDSSVLQQVREGYNYVGVTPYGEDDLLHVRVVVGSRGAEQLLLQALYPLSHRISDLSETVQAAFTRYRELAFLRQSLKFSFSLALSLVLLFSLLTAVWAAVVSARRLLSPVSDLAIATRAVADGDYSTQLPPPRARDELGFLVTSFNSMTRRIAQARDQAAESQRQVEAQRAFLESVLSHLSSGVIAFDGSGGLLTANTAASTILGIDLGSLAGRPLAAMAEARPELAGLVEAVEDARASETPEWERQVVVVSDEGRKILRCGGSPLPMGEGGALGRLLMIEDVTTLVQAQRDAAWGEVARRLAHEIKNPLTPIQLSAERLRRRYLGRLGKEEGEVLDRATHTIVQQVEAMKSMVNAFSDYARPSRMEVKSLAPDALVGEVMELYRATGRARLALELRAGGARVKGDGVKLRQVIHNLVKNALEALPEDDSGLIRVSTRVIGEDASVLELAVEDNGPGFERELAGRALEPYVTTKERGTGLGLAIVRKIVEEHGGSIVLGQSELGGAKVTLCLPLSHDDAAPAGMAGAEK